MDRRRSRESRGRTHSVQLSSSLSAFFDFEIGIYFALKFVYLFHLDRDLKTINHFSMKEIAFRKFVIDSVLTAFASSSYQMDII